MSSRKVVIKKVETAAGVTFRVVKVSGPREPDADLIGSVMQTDELKKFIKNAGMQTTIELVE